MLDIGIARRLTPGVVGIRDVPGLAQFVDEIGRECHRLRWGVVERAEGVAAAFAGGERGVETHADHVDDLVLVEHRLAGETDVGEEAALVDVDLVLHEQLLGLAASHVGFGFVVRDNEFDWPAIDAAGLVDAIDRHLRPDQRGLAAGGGGARKRLQRTDLVRLGLAEGGLPRRRHQHACTERARGCRAVSDQPPARDLAAVPERLTPILRFRFVSHREFLPDRLQWCRHVP